LPFYFSDFLCSDIRNSAQFLQINNSTQLGKLPPKLSSILAYMATGIGRRKCKIIVNKRFLPHRLQGVGFVDET